MKVQSNLLKTTTLGATQKCLSWTGGRLMKHLYKMITKVVGFYSHNERFINNKVFLE